MRFVTWNSISKRMKFGPGQFSSEGRPRRLFDRLPCLSIPLLVLTLNGCSLIRNGVQDPGPVEPGRVVLRWKADGRFSGFNVYRSQDDGPNIKVNASPVKPLSVADSGIVPYEFEERGLLAGRDYYYLLEEIARDGTTRLWETPRRAVAQPLP